MTEEKCVHRWILAAAARTSVPAKCAYCGAERSFTGVSVDFADYARQYKNWRQKVKEPR